MKRHYLKLRCKRSAWHGCWLYLHCQLPMLTLHPCFCLSSVAGTFLHSAGYIPCIWVFFTGVELAFPLKGMQGRYSSAQTSSASCHWAMAVSLEVISISWQVAIIQASGFSLKGTSIPSTNCWASAIRHQLGRAPVHRAVLVLRSCNFDLKDETVILHVLLFSLGKTVYNFQDAE